MGNGAQHTPPPGLLEMVRAEVDRALGECERRHDPVLRDLAREAGKAKGVAYRNRERLIELSGQGPGLAGEIGRMKEDVDANEQRSRGNQAEIVKLKTERRAHLAWSAGGATAGGGILYGIIEAIKHLF